MYDVVRVDPAALKDVVVVRVRTREEARAWASALNLLARSRDGGARRYPFWFAAMVTGGKAKVTYAKQHIVG